MLLSSDAGLATRRALAGSPGAGSELRLMLPRLAVELSRDAPCCLSRQPWPSSPSPAIREEIVVIALLLDLANMIGGFLLAIGLLQRIPRVGDDLVQANTRVTPFGWVVGVVALVAGGYYLIVHLTSGPRVFHFEVIGIAVGVALLWDRLTGRPAPEHGAGTVLMGRSLLLAILGVIAIIVGVQGLFTPD
jgi:hypothetical protein